jgi:hypothetical protein
MDVIHKGMFGDSGRSVSFRAKSNLSCCASPGRLQDIGVGIRLDFSNRRYRDNGLPLCQ